MKRPIEKLYPIEVKAKHQIDETEIEEAQNSVYEFDETTDEKQYREPRRAAIHGEMTRRLLGQIRLFIVGLKVQKGSVSE